MNSKVLRDLMYLADRPRRRKWRLPLPPALWLLTRYVPVIQFSSVSERTASCAKYPSISFGEIGIVLNEEITEFFKKILSIRFVAPFAG